MKPEDELKTLFHKANQCSLDLPAEVARRIEYLTQAQVIIGKLSADAVRDYKHVYAQRKRAFAEAYLASTTHREQRAELAVTELREQEADLESAKVRWSCAFESNLEVINSLKYSLKVLMIEYNQS